MKTIKLCLILCVAALSFNSCSSDDDSDNGNISDTFIRFTIDDTDYDFNNIVTAESLSLTLNGNNGDGISNTGDTQIEIWLPLAPALGEFNLVGFEGDYRLSFTSDPMGFVFDFAESGSITITEITDEFIIGTFSATITSDNDTTITLTNGTFQAFNL